MKKHKLCRFLLGLVIAVCLVLSVVVWWSVQQNHSFTTTFYSMSSGEVEQPIRIVQLTDLHLNQFGEDNTQLVSRIAALKPDLIAAVGDMIKKDSDDFSVVMRLLEQLTDIAPVYYSPGNHEYDHTLVNPASTLIAQIEATGAVYVDNAIVTATVQGTTLHIGGICKNQADILKYTVTREMLSELSATDGFTLLLSHYPEGFIGNTMADYPFDLVLCGHAHGGQVRLPFADGLYSADQGFLPKYTSGMRTMSGSTVVISRGLGDSTSPIPRINNPPELVVIDIE